MTKTDVWANGWTPEQRAVLDELVASSAPIVIPRDVLDEMEANPDGPWKPWPRGEQ